MAKEYETTVEERRLLYDVLKDLPHEHVYRALHLWEYGKNIVSALRIPNSDAEFAHELVETLARHAVLRDHDLFQLLADEFPWAFPRIAAVHERIVGPPSLVAPANQADIEEMASELLLADPARALPPPANVRVFICYRRDDCQGHAGRLFDSLRARYGGDAVFVDFGSLGAGQQFERRIGDELIASSVVILIVGSRWLVRHPYYFWQNRLWDRRDWVRRELVTSRALHRPIVPVLVHGARMPSAQVLPPPLRFLVARQFEELRDASWAGDVERLAAQLERAARRRQWH